MSKEGPADIEELAYSFAAARTAKEMGIAGGGGFTAGVVKVLASDREQTVHALRDNQPVECAEDKEFEAQLAQSDPTKDYGHLRHYAGIISARLRQLDKRCKAANARADKAESLLKRESGALPLLIEVCKEQMRDYEKQYAGQIIPYHTEQKILKLVRALKEAGVTPEDFNDIEGGSE